MQISAISRRPLHAAPILEDEKKKYQHSAAGWLHTFRTRKRSSDDSRDGHFLRLYVRSSMT